MLNKIQKIMLYIFINGYRTQLLTLIEKYKDRRGDNKENGRFGFFSDVHIISPEQSSQEIDVCKLLENNGKQQVFPVLTDNAIGKDSQGTHRCRWQVNNEINFEFVCVDGLNLKELVQDI